MCVCVYAIETCINCASTEAKATITLGRQPAKYSKTTSTQAATVAMAVASCSLPPPSALSLSLGSFCTLGATRMAAIYDVPVSLDVCANAFKYWFSVCVSHLVAYRVCVDKLSSPRRTNNREYL